MSVERYDSTKIYQVGDVVWEYNYIEYWPNGGEQTKLNFTCIKHHDPLTSYGYLAPIIPGYLTNPNEKYYHDVFLLPQFWEVIYPEWSADDKYTEGSIVQYKGNFYIAGIHFIINVADEDYGKYRELPNQPPNELEDENGIRPWMIKGASHKVPSFSLCPYNLERIGTPQNSDKFYSDPYSFVNGGHNYIPWSIGLPCYYGVGANTPYGATLECYMNYPDIYYNKGLPDEVKVREGGTTEAGRCGVAFQTHGYAGIFYGISEPLAYEDKDADPIVGTGFYSNGNIDASPDGATPFEDHSQYNQSYHHTGYIFFSHNHPLFFRRKLDIRVAIFKGRRFWKQVKNPNWNQYNNLPYYVYVLNEETNYEVEDRSGTPTDDCFDNVLVEGMHYDGWVVGDNQVSKVTLDSGNMIFSYHASWNPKLAWSPELKIEKND